jgi:hypothetical protein
MGALFQDRLADWPVGRNITLTLTLDSLDQRSETELASREWEYNGTQQERIGLENLEYRSFRRIVEEDLVCDSKTLCVL